MEDELRILSQPPLDGLEDLAQRLNALLNVPRHLEVGEPELDFLEHREGDRVDEYDTAIDTACIYDQHLLVALLQAEELRLGVIEGATIVQPDEVLPTLV